MRRLAAVAAGRAAARVSRRTSGRDDGQVSILIIGLLGVVLLLVMGGVDVTAAQIARARLFDASDSAALEAANALDESGGVQRRDR